MKMNASICLFKSALDIGRAYYIRIRLIFKAPDGGCDYTYSAKVRHRSLATLMNTSIREALAPEVYIVILTFFQCLAFTFLSTAYYLQLLHSADVIGCHIAMHNDCASLQIGHDNYREVRSPKLIAYFNLNINEKIKDIPFSARLLDWACGKTP